MKESQAVTTTVKIYFERKVEEFHQFGNEIPLILQWEDYCYSTLSKNIMLDENLQENFWHILGL